MYKGYVTTDGSKPTISFWAHDSNTDYNGNSWLYCTTTLSCIFFVVNHIIENPLYFFDHDVMGKQINILPVDFNIQSVMLGPDVPG